MAQGFEVGNWVEVRTKEEILGTLDERGRLDGMPFMPEMFQYCGQKFRISKSAHKTCDYTTQYPYHSRRLKETVHLETRCDGAAHGGCQAGCLLYWRTAWLKPISGPDDVVLESGIAIGENRGTTSGCTELTVLANTEDRTVSDGRKKFVCQATQVPDFTTPLAWWDIRQYVQDYRSGNVGLERIVSALVYSTFYHLSQMGIGLGPLMRRFYNKFYRLWGGTPFPRNPGFILEGQQTPSETLNLQEGEWVRVKSQEEILKTVDSSNRNRGMYWDAELVPYCGGTYQVLKRVTRLIDEKTGTMIEMKNPCIILDTVVCQARYSACRMLCPKSMYPYWREIWLERARPNGQTLTELAKTATVPVDTVSPKVTA